MKIFLPAFFLCSALGIVLAAQDSASPAPQNRQAEGTRLTTIMGTVRADGEKLTFVTDQRAWNVDNPQILRGHEGKSLPVSCLSRKLAKRSLALPRFTL